MRWTRISIFVLTCGIAGVAWQVASSDNGYTQSTAAAAEPAPQADQPAPDNGPRRRDRPDGQQPGRPDGRGGPRPGFGQGNGRNFLPPGLPDIDKSDPNDDEWKEVADFWQDQSPKRWAEYVKYLESIQAKIDAAAGNPGPDLDKLKNRFAGVRRSLAMRFRMVQALDNPQQADQHKYALDQMKTEEDLFDAFRCMKLAPDNAELATQFKTLLGKYVDHSFDERDARIRSLKLLVATEEQRLNEDRNDRDKVIERQRGRFEHQFAPLLNLPATKPAP